MVLHDLLPAENHVRAHIIQLKDNWWDEHNGSCNCLHSDVSMGAAIATLGLFLVDLLIDAAVAGAAFASAALGTAAGLALDAGLLALGALPSILPAIAGPLAYTAVGYTLFNSPWIIGGAVFTGLAFSGSLIAQIALSTGVGAQPQGGSGPLSIPPPNNQPALPPPPFIEPYVPPIDGSVDRWGNRILDFIDRVYEGVDNIRRAYRTAQSTAQSRGSIQSNPLTEEGYAEEDLPLDLTAQEGWYNRWFGSADLTAQTSRTLTLYEAELERERKRIERQKKLVEKVKKAKKGKKVTKRVTKKKKTVKKKNVRRNVCKPVCNAKRTVRIQSRNSKKRRVCSNAGYYRANFAGPNNVQQVRNFANSRKVGSKKKSVRSKSRK